MQFARYGGHGVEEFPGFFYGHIQHLADVFAFVLHFEGFAVVAFAVAHFAGHIHVGQEVHLHFADIALLLEVIGRLKGKGNSIVSIEHNLDVIKTADYIVDLGPEGGDGGGRIIAKGSPEEVVKVKGSYTGKYLKVVLK